MSQLSEVATWGRQWQKEGDWTSHTLTQANARNIVSAYLKFIKLMSGWAPISHISKGLDIGSGAGYTASAFSTQSGLQMTASEWSEDGLSLISRENPGLPCRIIDVRTFNDNSAWDLIVCRELYPFTRVNAFSEQYDIISRIIDALTPNGVFMLIGSDVTYPHCADYDLLISSFRKDSRVKLVAQPFLEALLLRISGFSFLGRTAYKVLNRLAEFLFPLIKGKKWAAIRIMIFQKA